MQTQVIRHLHGDLEGDSDTSNAAVLHDGNKIITAMFWLLKSLFTVCVRKKTQSIFDPASVRSLTQFSLTIFTSGDQTPTQLDKIQRHLAFLAH